MAKNQPMTPPAGDEIFLLKMGEMVLKGLNRRTFEERLMGNARRRLEKFGKFRIYSRQSITYIEPKTEDCDMDGAFETLTRLFGVVGLSRAKACEKTPEAILETAKTYLHDDLMAARRFKVESKRSDKSFPLTSIQLSQFVGGELNEAFPHIVADMHTPDLIVHVEVRDFAAYVHANPTPGAGGLPVGVGGHAVSLLSGGIDSPVASWMMARRGVWLEMVHFESPPYTSPQAQEKVLRLAQELAPWCGQLLVHIVPFTEIQEEIRRACPEEYFTLIMRRFMMRLAQAVARQQGCQALVTGESLGQVASQTMASLAVTENAVDMPILRPLIGIDKVEIIHTSRRIGTYETSILPFEDCCTVFTPRHPNTRPRIPDVIAAESALDVDALMEKALSGVQRVRIKNDGTLVRLTDDRPPRI